MKLVLAPTSLLWCVTCSMWEIFQRQISKSLNRSLWLFYLGFISFTCVYFLKFSLEDKKVDIMII